MPKCPVGRCPCSYRKLKKIEVMFVWLIHVAIRTKYKYNVYELQLIAHTYEHIYAKISCP